MNNPSSHRSETTHPSPLLTFNTKHQRLNRLMRIVRSQAPSAQLKQHIAPMNSPTIGTSTKECHRNINGDDDLFKNPLTNRETPSDFAKSGPMLTASNHKYPLHGSELDTRLVDIYDQWSVEDYINGNDITSFINGLQHNQNNEHTSDELRAINILCAKLLIEDAAHAQLTSDFVASLKFSILYTHLKNNHDEQGVHILLRHIAESKDQNLFLINMVSSGERNAPYHHATGQLITRHPKGSLDKPLVSININKGYKKNLLLSRGQYTFRSLPVNPPLSMLRYPKLDGHPNTTKLTGRDQIIGNCGNIAFKEALQLACAFENPQFKRAFFMTKRRFMPFVESTSRVLKTQFKSNYGFGENHQVRVQDKIGELLLQQLKKKAIRDPSTDNNRAVTRVETLIKLRQAHKIDRDTAIGDSSLQVKRPMRRLSPELIKSVDLNPVTPDPLIDVKTIKRMGLTINDYLGISSNHSQDVKQLMMALHSLWKEDAGTEDQKSNLTKQAITESIQAAETYHKKVAIIEQLISFTSVDLENQPYALAIKRIIQKTSSQHLRLLHKDSNQIKMIKDPKIKQILQILVKDGNLNDTHALLSSLLIHKVDERRGLLQYCCRLFKEEASHRHHRHCRWFVRQLAADNQFQDNLQSAIQNEQSIKSIHFWSKLIEQFINIQSKRFTKPAFGYSGPTVTAQKQALRLAWGNAFLSMGQRQLTHSSHIENNRGIQAILFSLKLGVDQRHLKDQAAISSAVVHALNRLSGQPFLDAIHLCLQSDIARTTMQSLDQKRLANKLLAEYQKEGINNSDLTVSAITYLNSEAKAIFLYGITEEKQLFRTLSSVTRKKIILLASQLLKERNDFSNQSAQHLSSYLIEEIRTDIEHQLTVINNKQDTDGADIHYISKLIHCLPHS